MIDSVEEPPPSYSPVLDVVALPSGKKLQTNARDGVLFAKSGLLVRARTSATLLVPTGSGLRIGWGQIHEPVAQIAVPSCEGPRAWLAFAGGFYTPEPACLELVVRDARGSEAKLRVAVGADCD